ncbi:MAG: formylglycine-generating enzyme family protein [Spirochaetia bacterium]|nr:formylglycine-generating enzyme family protein [Spirochaetia bacterium]
MMRKTLMVLAAAMLFCQASYALMGDEPDRSKADMPEGAAKLLPDNGDVIASVAADLNGDAEEDFLVAFEYLNGKRELIIVVKKGKKYVLASRSWRAIMCADCGGVYGDPFVRIWAEKKKFGIDHFGGSNWKWSNNSVFGYSQRDNKWQLVDFQASNYDLDANADTKQYKPADFGLVNLEDYDLDTFLSGENLGPVPDETKVAAKEQLTAVAAEKTAVAESSFTPTPVPTYVYNRPEQLKNTEMISIPGGTFTQSDGAVSFGHTVSPYSIGKYPVTYELWYVVKAWAEKNGYSFELDGQDKRFNARELPLKDSPNPALGMEWRDAIVWCNAYSQMMKLKPGYCSDPEFKNPIKSSKKGDFPSSVNKAKGSFDNPYTDWAGNGYRLPTEGEWMYAAMYVDGGKWADISAQKNEANGSGFVYAPERGAEMLWDIYEAYPQSAQKDYRGPDNPNRPHVIHGGPDRDVLEKKGTYVPAAIGKRESIYSLAGDIYNGFRVARSK